MDRQQQSIVVPRDKSRPVVISPYQPQWPAQFTAQAKQLRQAIGQTALRIDHIGSTSVPGLGAKDIIDIQITVVSLDDCAEFITCMLAAGYRQRGDVRYDSLVGHQPETLKKRYFREAQGEPRVHIHVREQGSINQRYPLLFRDYLRQNTAVRLSYELIKQRLAAIFPDCIDGYLFIKDPLMDVIYQGALQWAESNHWSPDTHYI